mmetsp:Transcript_75128/g.149191  ORF Transcript_75128/g.149191 Transcript_75128/m.149191 type:complete len:101 (-) Transcript_75128:93-395(-)
MYTFVNLPISTVAGTLTSTTLSITFSKAVPAADMGAALSVLDVLNAAVGVVAPLYGGALLGQLGVGSQPALSAVHYIICLAVLLISLPSFVAAQPKDKEA